METREALGRALVKKATLHGEFLLRSGRTSNIYFDKYLFEADPGMLKRIAEEMLPLLPPDTDALAGLEMGGIPIATMLAQLSGLPALFVRKKAKEYGTCKLAEGGETEGRKLVVVEDVVTSGGQIILSSRELRKLGADLSVVLCVIDRESGGTEKLAQEHLELRPLFRMSELQPTKA